MDGGGIARLFGKPLRRTLMQPLLFFQRTKRQIRAYFPSTKKPATYQVTGRKHYNQKAILYTGNYF
jgi:hypothetical protein